MRNTKPFSSISVAVTLLLSGCTGQIGDDDAPEPGAVQPAGAPRPAAHDLTRPPVRNGSGEPSSPSSSTPSPAPAPTPTVGSAVPGPIAPVEVAAAACRPPAARLWKLTPDQYTNTVRALLPNAGRPGDTLRSTVTRAGYTNAPDVPQMSEPHVVALFEASTQLAQLGAEAKAVLPACAAAATLDRACAETFLRDFGKKAFRRPLTKDEIDSLIAFQVSESSLRGAVRSWRQLLRVLLLSPRFLFRTELGDRPVGSGVSRLSPYEVASAMSYFLVDGPPDAELMVAADRNALGTADQVKMQARRLLTSPAAVGSLGKFFAETWAPPDVAGAMKDGKAYPLWSAELGADMATEHGKFVEEVVWRDGGRLSTFLSAPFSMMNERLAKLYGITGVTGTTFKRVALPAGQRSGLLTQGGFLTAHASDKESSVVRRGRFVREQFLCQSIPPPPPNISAVPPPLEGTRTQRERMQRHSADPSCAGCHSLMDPLGLAFENYDAIGAYRTTELGRTVDAKGAVVGTPNTDGPVGHALDLTTRLAGSRDTAACFGRRLFEYAAGADQSSADACAAATLGQTWQAAGGNLLDAVVAVVASDAFVTRKPLAGAQP